MSWRPLRRPSAEPHWRSLYRPPSPRAPEPSPSAEGWEPRPLPVAYASDWDVFLHRGGHLEEVVVPGGKHGKPMRYRQPYRIIVCPDCGCSRYDTGGPHALRWSPDFTSKVDCVGRLHP